MIGFFSFYFFMSVICQITFVRSQLFRNHIFSVSAESVSFRAFKVSFSSRNKYSRNRIVIPKNKREWNKLKMLSCTVSSYSYHTFVYVDQ
jgi:hypothetical protein